MPILDLGAIIGPQGPQGIPGPVGPQGAQGNPTTVNGKTGAEITLTAADVGAAALGTAVRQNFAVNSNLMDPINQRGVSGTITDAGYFIDMWYKSNGVNAVLSSNGVELSLAVEPSPSAGWGQGITQNIELDLVPLRGQTMTFSVLADNASGAAGARVRFSNGASTDDYCGGLSLEITGDGGIFSATGIVPDTAVSCKIQIGNNGTGGTWGVRVKLVKLELGVGQTLYHNGAFIDYPNYAAELEKCQRHMIVIPPTVSLRSANRTSKRFYFMLPVPTTMRGVFTIEAEEDAIRLLRADTLEEKTGFTFTATTNAPGGIMLYAASEASHNLTDAILYFNKNTVIRCE